MKILIIGRGVISTQYAWVFENTGNEVVFYVRPGRKEYYGEIIHLNIKDGRQNKKEQSIHENWKINMIEEIPDNHDFDLIFVSVKHTQLDSVIENLKGKTCGATILIANNYWGRLVDVENNFPDNTVIWGFPGAGGRYEERNNLYGGFLNSFFIEKSPTSSSKLRYHDILNLFKNAGIKTNGVKNMQSWLWGHFIMNAAMMDTAKEAGTIKNIFENTAYIKDLIQKMKNMSFIIIKREEDVDLLTKTIISLPQFLSVWLFQFLGNPNTLSGQIMLSIESDNHKVASIDTSFYKDVMKYL